MAFNFIKSQLLKVIEWTDDSRDLLVYKFPMAPNTEIMMGSALTVRESQVAIFVNKGQIADVFQPGFYKLSTDNMPLLTKIMSWKYGFNSPFKAEVYFVNTKQFTDQKWGTVNPIMLRDADFGMIRIRGYGKFSFRVDDPAAFLKELFGTNSSFETKDITDYLKSILIQNISDTIAELKIPALDLATQYREISAAVTEHSNKDFQKMGLQLVNTIVENISLPEEVEKMMDTRTSMGVMGDKMGAFMQYQTAHAIRDAAQNEGNGLAGAGMGLGAGLGLGNVFAQNFAQGMAQAASPATPAAPAAPAVETQPCPKCGAQVRKGAKFCPECGSKMISTVKCPKCGAEVRASAKFCPECGSKMDAGPEKKTCPKCGATCKAGAKFCPECGEKF